MSIVKIHIQVNFVDLSIYADLYRVHLSGEFDVKCFLFVVAVAGIFSTNEAAQNQVAFGLRMYAGSTLITLTLLWGFCIMLNYEKLPEKKQISVNAHQESSTKYLPLREKLSILNG